MAFVLLVLVLTVAGMGCNSPRMGPTPSGYFFWLETVHVTDPQGGRISFEVAELELIVSVENAQGHPINGVLVEFSMDSAWGSGAILFPKLVSTRGGKAHAIFRVFETGHAPVVARVETLRQKVIVDISRQEEPDA